jgi:acyl-CoA synthetase (NDP forming)
VAALRQAFKDMHAAAKSASIQLTGIIVAEQVKGRRELMIGARVDPVFGPVVLVGDGGKYVEAMPDLQVLMAPFSVADVGSALNRLRIAPLLSGVRGEPPLDVKAFCESAVAVGQMMTDEKLGISQLDINPVMVGSLGQGCVSLDAVIYRKENT